MVLRSAGDVGCAHCKAIGADRSCQVCTRLVCERCASDWATCDEPSGRVVRLGMTARVRDIDPLGTYALVSHWRQPLRLFDLRALAWVPAIRWERLMYLAWRSAPPRLTAAGQVIYPAGIPSSESGFMFTGMRRRDITGGRDRMLDRTEGHAPAHGTGVSADGDVFYYVTNEQRVLVAPPEHAPGAYEPLPRKVIQAVHVDGARMLMASASWSELAVHRIDDEHGLVRLAHTRTVAEGNVHWIALAGEWVVAAVASSTFELRYEARRLDPEQGVSAIVHRFVAPLPFRAAALARDGRHLAFAIGATLRVVDLESGLFTDFDEHTDAINAVRFAREDHVLISADTDNRVILRPRSKTGYARALLAVDLP